MLSEPRHRAAFPVWAGASDRQWNDWRWQFKNRITTVGQLESAFPLTHSEREAADRSRELFRLGITPHYATLIDPDDPFCPIRRQAIPQIEELTRLDCETADPLHEDTDSPVPGLTHRYPDRVLLLITHECALYCRYCTRRRIVGDGAGSHRSRIDTAIDYIRATTSIRDVLISGGEPLGLSDDRLEDVLAKLREIDHVEIIRIGTRMPVVMPQRITPELVAMLRRFHPLWLNTHFNHPLELSPAVTRAAMERIADAGIPTGNQSVLLKGVNDCPIVMRKLLHGLVKLRCRPYYLYSCDMAEGLGQFRTPVETGLAIMESLWGHTSGFAIPTFVVDAPQGGGKIPLLPNYKLAHGNGQVLLRNYQGKRFIYHEGTAADHVIDTVCRICGTDHSGIAAGPAADNWSTRRPSYAATSPAGAGEDAATNPRDVRRYGARGAGTGSP
jgi:lysine 2,3-aminomutase